MTTNGFVFRCKVTRKDDKPFNDFVIAWTYEEAKNIFSGRWEHCRYEVNEVERIC